MGSNTGTVSTSYATGNIAGTSSLGGLMGSSTTGAVSNSYATGSVTQAHPKTGSPQIARSERRARRVPARGHGAEPKEACKASSDASRMSRAGMTAPKKSAPMPGPMLR
jgi:hypothetical protein